jgi:hypothetical protein
MSKRYRPCLRAADWNLIKSVFENLRAGAPNPPAARRLTLGGCIVRSASPFRDVRRITYLPDSGSRRPCRFDIKCQLTNTFNGLPLAAYGTRTCIPPLLPNLRGPQVGLPAVAVSRSRLRRSLPSVLPAPHDHTSHPAEPRQRSASVTALQATVGRVDGARARLRVEVNAVARRVTPHASCIRILVRTRWLRSLLSACA